MKINKTKKKTKRKCFVLVSYLWAWGLPWTVVNISTDIPFKKVDFPPSQQVSLGNSFLVRGRNFCVVPLLSMGTPYANF